MWYEVLQSDLIPINNIKRRENEKAPVNYLYIYYYGANLPERRYLGYVFCSLMYRYDEGRAEAFCVIICKVYK